MPDLPSPPETPTPWYVTATMWVAVLFVMFVVFPAAVIGLLRLVGFR